MNYTIKGSFFHIKNYDLEDTIDYLKQLGMTFNSKIKLEEIVFYIELKQLPDIILKLLENGYLSKKRVFDILKISTKGLVLYVCSFEGGDGYIFLPNENIISIHTVSDHFVTTIEWN